MSKDSDMFVAVGTLIVMVIGFTIYFELQILDLKTKLDPITIKCENVSYDNYYNKTACETGGICFGIACVTDNCERKTYCDGENCIQHITDRRCSLT